MVSLALEDVVRGPACEQRADDAGDLKRGHCPASLGDVEAAALGEELRSPVEDTHSHHIHEEVGNAERPHPAILPNHLHLKLLAVFLVLHVNLSERRAGQVGQASVLRLVAQAHQHEHRATEGDDGRNPEAPFPRAYVCGVVESLCRGVSHVVVGQVLGYPCHHVSVGTHVGAERAHDGAAHYHGEGGAHRV